MKKNRTINQSLSADLKACTTLAVDLAKRVFQLAGEDALGQVIFEDRIKSREAFQAFLHQLPASVAVLVETGPGAQAWARLLQTQGNPVRILPAQLVATHRSGPKNDRNDALAILRAGRDCKISAVPLKVRAHRAAGEVPSVGGTPHPTTPLPHHLTTPLSTSSTPNAATTLSSSHPQSPHSAPSPAPAQTPTPAPRYPPPPPPNHPHRQPDPPPDIHQ